jgi:hypothetical protein
MLEARTASHARRPAAAGMQSADNSDFARNSEGRMIIREQEAKKGIVSDIILLHMLCRLQRLSMVLCHILFIL